ncbi:MAG: alpha/beta fold hydrolase, partial [Anaerolineaceae bacterium]
FDALSSMYKIITCPTLIIWGKEDAIVPLNVGVRLNNELKNAKLVIINECGHNPHEEKSSDVVDAIVSFLHDPIN